MHCSIFGQNASNYAIRYFHHQQLWQIITKMCATSILGKTSLPFLLAFAPPPLACNVGNFFTFEKVSKSILAAPLPPHEYLGRYPFKNEDHFGQGRVPQFGQCPRDRVFFSGKFSLSQTGCQHKGLLSSWPQIRRIVGANHRGRGASD